MSDFSERILHVDDDEIAKLMSHPCRVIQVSEC